jgi:hypothetical protein
MSGVDYTQALEGASKTVNRADGSKLRCPWFGWTTGASRARLRIHCRRMESRCAFTRGARVACDCLRSAVPRPFHNRHRRDHRTVFRSRSSSQESSSRCSGSGPWEPSSRRASPATTTCRDMRMPSSRRSAPRITDRSCPFCRRSSTRIGMASLVRSISRARSS